MVSVYSFHLIYTCERGLKDELFFNRYHSTLSGNCHWSIIPTSSDTALVTASQGSDEAGRTLRVYLLLQGLLSARWGPS